jgi:hypothetical protein
MKLILATSAHYRNLAATAVTLFFATAVIALIDGATPKAAALMGTAALGVLGRSALQAMKDVGHKQATTELAALTEPQVLAP